MKVVSLFVTQTNFEIEKMKNSNNLKLTENRWKLIATIRIMNIFFMKSEIQSFSKQNKNISNWKKNVYLQIKSSKTISFFGENKQ